MKTAITLASLAIAFALNISTGVLADENAPVRVPSPSEPSILWSNPPEEKHLPLTPGAEHRTFRSQLVDQDVGYIVYLPPQYESKTDQRFPVIYVLHGNGGNELTSLNVVELLHEQIVANRIPPMIMVLPNGGKSTFYKNSHDRKYPIEDIFLKELIPLVDTTYRTIADASGRCIEGFSMGGRGSTRLAMKHPGMFCSLFCEAGNVPPLLAQFDAIPEDQRARFMLGPDRANWEADDVYANCEKNRKAIKKNVRIQIACGTKDGGHLPTVKLYHERLLELGIDHTYIELQGLAHKRSEMLRQLGPIWFDGHVAALRASGAIQ